MQIEVLPDEEAVARRGADLIAQLSRDAVLSRGRFLMAVSGGKNPWRMFRLLANDDLPWGRIHLFQVDERIAPDGHPDRNLTHLRESLIDRVPLRPEHVHPMPVTGGDLETAANEYADLLRTVAGPAPVLDLVHLGLGPDGHTASLVPGDPVLEVVDRDVATTGIYQGRRRMTLTFPIINRARQILWLVTGETKAPMLLRIRNRDPSIPAGRIRGDQAIVVADPAATSLLG